MGKVSVKRRQFVIKKKRRIKSKIQILKGEYLNTKDKSKKKKILEKIQNLAPSYPKKNILDGK